MLKNADKIKMRTLNLYFVYKNYRKLLSYNTHTTHTSTLNE